MKAEDWLKDYKDAKAGKKKMSKKNQMIQGLEILIEKIQKTPEDEITFMMRSQPNEPIEVTSIASPYREWKRTFGCTIVTEITFSGETERKEWDAAQVLEKQDEINRENWKRKQRKNMPEKVTDDTIMWFGEHKGKKMANVPASYLWYMYDSGRAFGNLRDYIEDNLDAIKSELHE